MRRLPGSRRCPENRKSPAVAGLFEERLKGLEPSTFCMARGRQGAQAKYVLPANRQNLLTLADGSVPFLSVSDCRVPGAKPARVVPGCPAYPANVIPYRSRRRRLQPLRRRFGATEPVGPTALSVVVEAVAYIGDAAVAPPAAQDVTRRRAIAARRAMHATIAVAPAAVDAADRDVSTSAAT